MLQAAALSVAAQGISVLPYAPGEGITFTAPGGYSMRLSGFAQPSVETRQYPQMGDHTAYTRFRMRRMYTRINGEAANEKLSYQLQFDLTGSSDGGPDAGTNNYLLDAWIAYRPMRNLTFTFGQQNTFTDNREMGFRSNTTQLQERSQLSLAFASIREFGLFITSDVKFGKHSHIQPMFSVTNGDGVNVFAQDHGGLKTGGRIDVIPFGKFSGQNQFMGVDMEYERSPKLVFGAAYSLNKGISDRRGRASGTVLYQDGSGNESLPDYRKFVADFLFKYRGFTVLGEYTRAMASVPDDITKYVRTDGTLSSNFLVKRGQDSRGQDSLVTDVPAAVKARMMVGAAYNLQGGYLFKNGISLDARFTRLIPESDSFLRNGTFYNRSKYYTLCVGKYLGRSYGARVQAMFTYNTAEDGSVTLLKKQLSGSEISGALMLTISL